MDKAILKQLEALEAKVIKKTNIITTDEKGKKKRWEAIEFYAHILPPYDEERPKPPKYKNIEFVGDLSKSGKMKDIILDVYEIFVNDEREG